jgi:hypothetical protein
LRSSEDISRDIRRRKLSEAFSCMNKLKNALSLHEQIVYIQQIAITDIRMSDGIFCYSVSCLCLLFKIIVSNVCVALRENVISDIKTFTILLSRKYCVAVY